ncbi:hypothetical protein Y1Q_0005000 [Alligator mississippiensis]|uniref:Uncharacterized protein n=1 Tax=Alligator mississippiensis TaxID=8496 RepID=A0A151PJD7_ALLMI|nr:hypothetical protein Y1Q_0005000 [Alligator mississippiensis]
MKGLKDWHQRDPCGGKRVIRYTCLGRQGVDLGRLWGELTEKQPGARQLEQRRASLPKAGSSREQDFLKQEH